MDFLKRFISHDFFKSKIVDWLLVLSLIVNIANWAVLLIFIRSVDSGIILHYNIYFGVDSIGDWRQVFVMPFIGLILFILNALLAYFFYAKKERIASYILLLATFMAQISLIIATTSVIIINY